MDSLYGKKLIKGVSWVFLVNIATAFLNFVFLLYFARNLGANIMGGYASLIVALDLITAVFRFGFNQAVIKTQFDSEIYSAALFAVSAQSLLTIVVTFFVYLFISYVLMYSIDDLFIPGALLLFARIALNYSTLFYAKLEVNLEYGKIAVLKLVSSMLGIMVGYLLLVDQSGVYTLIARDFVMNFILLALIVYVAKPSFTFKIMRRSWRRIWSFSSGVWYLNLFERLSLRIDYGIIGAMLGKESLGIYFTIRSIFEGLLGFVVNPIQTVLFSFYCSLDSRIQIFLKAFRLTIIWIIVLTLFGITVSYYFGDIVLTLLLGNEFTIGVDMLYGFTIMMMSNIIYEHNKVFSMSIGRHMQFLAPRLIQIISLIAFTYPFVKYFGHMGAGMATGLGAMMLALSSNYIILRQIKAEKIKE